MLERIRFVLQATREDKGFSELCREFGISRKTGYKWLARYRAWGPDGCHKWKALPRTIGTSARIEEFASLLRCQRCAPNPCFTEGGESSRCLVMIIPG
jgi:transposase-like protein